MQTETIAIAMDISVRILHEQHAGIKLTLYVMILRTLKFLMHNMFAVISSQFKIARSTKTWRRRIYVYTGVIKFWGPLKMETPPITPRDFRAARFTITLSRFSLVSMHTLDFSKADKSTVRKRVKFVSPRTPDYTQFSTLHARETRLKAGSRKPLLACRVLSGVKIVMQVYGTVVVV